MDTVGTLVIKNTVRGGKQIEHSGDIIIMGDVYAGTTITAGGNITVMGKATGSLTAGARIGDMAIIAVNKFNSAYIRIGRYSARHETEAIVGPVFLSVENGQIMCKRIGTK